MDAKTSDSDLLSETAVIVDADLEIDNDLSVDNPLHALQQEIAAMPAIDPDRVEAVINKLRNGNLDILGTELERFASEQRIAARIIEESIMAAPEIPKQHLKPESENTD